MRDRRRDLERRGCESVISSDGTINTMRKLIAFDDETMAALTQLSRNRMATLQEFAEEAFADLLKKHGVPIDLKEALRRSAGIKKKQS